MLTAGDECHLLEQELLRVSIGEWGLVLVDLMLPWDSGDLASILCLLNSQG